MPTVRHSGVKAMIQLLNRSPEPIAPKAQSYAEQRIAMDGLGGTFPLAEGVTQSERTLARRPCLAHTPEGALDGAGVLYLHGGGYCVGSPTSHRGLCAMLAQRTGATVFALDYRLAPEHPHPAAVEDAADAVTVLREEGVRRIVVSGDSAGGGLALATALLLKARGAPQPNGLYLLSPWADLTQTAPSVSTQAEFDPILTKAGLDQMAADYAQGASLTAPLVSPVYGDYAGLAPTFIQVGSDEIIRDDSALVFAAAKSEGVEAALEIWPQMIHVFPVFFPLLAEGDRALTAGAAWVRGRLA
jgi:acetyl esterase/lipase